MKEELWPGKLIHSSGPIELAIVLPPGKSLGSLHVGDYVILRGQPAIVTHVDSTTLSPTVTVESPPTERQETLGRLTGRKPEDFIP